MQAVYLITSLLSVGVVSAQSVGAYGQCGGGGWTGGTACVSGSSCSVINPYYSQYLPNSGGTTLVTSQKAATSATAATKVVTIGAPAASGYVTRSGSGFVLNGKVFRFGGTNAYWATSLPSTDLNSLFSQMKSAGLTVLRIFAWSDNIGSASSSSFKYWSGSTNTPNPAAFAAHMDPIIAAAEASGIKLVIPMIGNWGPSINLYIQQILGSSAKHDTFFSNAQIIAAYKKYVFFFVNRYKTSPAVFAWELMNEPRCTGDDNRGASSSCNTAMLTNWVSQISSYIKSIDSNHMVTVGDEGWFTTAQGYGSSYPYSGSEGIDWVSNLKLGSIDYGTVHLYPSSWGQTDAWGSTWVTQHGDQAKKWANQLSSKNLAQPILGHVRARSTPG
ncbi:hypothetical protein LTR78_010877 [Recurvomyces mirabilis]|uniref:mannan endo-1,4-beta-mannosidase n=1 Tax=Recurvomyces mirabilis TaxID=574656 RepID=A0AAE0TM17_9PEZI|nr:hypothetical protein LTR78_010877 [Recurvomyces mirabilis]KAK5149887.1 hypothetical protein LTS14_010602 [Recurvomyces mirabilis]